MATFNEFQRELQKRNIDPNTAYMFTLVYERLAHVMKEHEQFAKALMQIAVNLQDFVTVREQDRALIERVMKGQREPGVDVVSVANDPDDKKH